MARFIEDHYEKKICMLILLITCSMGFTGQPIQSQIALEQHRYKVAVTISSDNESTKNLIESHIKRELRNSGYATLRRRPSEDKGIAMKPILRTMIREEKLATFEKTGLNPI